MTTMVLYGTAIALAGASVPQEKVPIDKVPKEVVAAVKAKFPKADLKGASKEKDNGKDVYEIDIVVDKQAMHAMVTAAGKLYEIHREIDAKTVPDKAANAVKSKYPKARWEGVEEIADADGKILAYEVTVEAAKGAFVEVRVNLDGRIESETKIEPKK
jgi:hypothetical protein